MIDTKPFIKLFKTPLGYYCYDVNTFSMLSITEGMYEILIGNEKLKDKEVRNRIKKLKENGYLSEHRPKRIEHPYNNFIHEYLDNNIKKITLQITQNCNLMCKYCAYAYPEEGKQRSRSNTNMPLNIAKKGIIYLFNHCKNEKEVNVGFYGGEPLLEFKKIKELVHYAKKIANEKNKSVSFSLTTNATMLTEEKIDFFVMHKFDIMISLDGPEDIHNKNRKYRNTGEGSFQDIMTNLELVKNKYPDFVKRLSINSVIDPENDFSCYNEFFTNYETMKKVRKRTSVLSTENLATRYSMDEDYYIFMKYEKFKLLLYMLGNLSYNNISNLMIQLESKIRRIGETFESNWNLSDVYHHGGPCIPGSGRLFIDISGNLFPCERCSELSDVMKIGNLDTGINCEAAKRILNIGQLTENECKDCWNIKYCSICAVKADSITHFSREKKLANCFDSKASSKHMIYDYLALLEMGYDCNDNSKMKNVSSL